MLETATTVRELTFGDAIKEAIAEEMRRDPSVVLMGEDVAEAGTTFKVLTGLVDEFGKDRIIDTPISEAGFSGLGVGAAMAGLRPIVDIMFGDFLTIIMDQMVNQAAKIHYMSGGKWKVPMVFRLTMGATRRSAAQHSQSLHAWPSHIPGPEGHRPVDAVRREGPVQGGRARRQPRRDLRAQDQLPQGQGAGARRRLRDSARRRRREARRAATSRSSRRAAWCRRRSPARSCSKRSASTSKSSIRARCGRSTRRRSSTRSRRRRAASSWTRGTGATACRRSWRRRWSRGCVLRSRRAGHAAVRDARADSVLAVARGHDGPERTRRRRAGAEVV